MLFISKLLSQIIFLIGLLGGIYLILIVGGGMEFYRLRLLGIMIFVMIYWSIGGAWFRFLNRNL